MKRRAGYTLLEVMLAIFIGVLLIAALYVALDVQLRYMQTGRNAVAEGQLARGILARMASDIRQHLGKQPAAASSTSTTSTTTTTTAPTSSTTSTDAAAAPAAGDAAASSTNSLGSTQFNYGVQGDETSLMLFVSAVPRYGRNDIDNQNGVSDLRRIAYSLIPGTGLARIESRSFSTDDADLADATPDILAQEVLALSFRYYDGASGSWVTTWDGSTTGPPVAIEITLGLQPPVDMILPRREVPQPTYYRLVVAIPSAIIEQEATTGSTTTTTP
jgi:prepilin-type N-terminal cleavage/methylation domain-containing protein